MGAEEGLIGHWILQGDALDHSGRGNDAANHGVSLQTGDFTGRDAYLEVADDDSLDFGDGDFTVAAWINTDAQLVDAPGDIITKFDPQTRKGFTVSLQAATSGYNSQSDSRQLFFGVDDGSEGTWTDCGRPNNRTHISDALTVFNGDLYAGTTDGADPADWAHVYRYEGDQAWTDLGRLGNGRTRGVYAMVVHDGQLYAATSSSHGHQPPEMDFGRVYRFRGDHDWEDLGQPGKNHRLNALASFQGQLYVAAFNIGDPAGYVYVYEGDQRWRQCGEFAGYPHALAVHDGRLFTAYPQGEVYAYDGSAWENLGNPLGSAAECSQIHSMGIHRGELLVGSWPKGKVAAWRNGEWIDLGRLGDATEVIALVPYNGSFYAGTIPRAEVFRFDEPGRWTSLRRLFDYPGFEPVPVGSGAKQVEDWSRASSLAVFQGKLFCSTATCYRTMIETPRENETRGKVCSYAAGNAVSLDRDLGGGWKHIACVRSENALQLYVDGELVASSPVEDSLDVSSDAPLLIGFGPQSHFHGQMREVRLYNRGLSADEIHSFKQTNPPVVN